MPSQVIAISLLTDDYLRFLEALIDWIRKSRETIENFDPDLISMEGFDDAVCLAITNALVQDINPLKHLAEAGLSPEELGYLQAKTDVTLVALVGMVDKIKALAGPAIMQVIYTEPTDSEDTSPAQINISFSLIHKEALDNSENHAILGIRSKVPQATPLPIHSFIEDPEYKKKLH